MAENVALYKISIHAPVKGATFFALDNLHQLSYFNPRPREGSDDRANYCTCYKRDFNPRPREGSDIIAT